MHIFFVPDILTTYELTEEESRHCLKVLRLSIGDEIKITDGKGFFYKAVIISTDRKKCTVSITETIKQEPLWQGNIHIAMAPTKNIDRTEWFVEKATEIGMDELSFLNCRYSERKIIKKERIEKIMVSAIKQSLKATLPQLNDMVSFTDFIRENKNEQKFIAHCYDGDKQPLNKVIQPGKSSVVLIGPEGDFSEDEVRLAIDNGFIPVSLGNSRLRTETAALISCFTLNLANQE